MTDLCAHDGIEDASDCPNAPRHVSTDWEDQLRIAKRQLEHDGVLPLPDVGTPVGTPAPVLERAGRLNRHF